MSGDPYWEDYNGHTTWNDDTNHLPVCAICGFLIKQYRALTIDYKWYCDRCIDEAKEYTGWDD